MRRATSRPGLGLLGGAVAITSGGDARCRAQAHPLRLDIPAARDCYGDYLQLP